MLKTLYWCKLIRRDEFSKLLEIGSIFFLVISPDACKYFYFIVSIFIGNAISLNKLHDSYGDKGRVLSNQVNNFDRSRKVIFPTALYQKCQIEMTRQKVWNENVKMIHACLFSNHISNTGSAAKLLGVVVVRRVIEVGRDLWRSSGHTSCPKQCQSTVGVSHVLFQSGRFQKSRCANCSTNTETSLFLHLIEMFFAEICDCCLSDFQGASPGNVTFRFRCIYSRSTRRNLCHCFSIFTKPHSHSLFPKVICIKTFERIGKDHRQCVQTAYQILNWVT